MTLPLASEDSSNSNVELPPLPDLLRRFVALPCHGTWFIAGVTFEVATNRQELLQSFPLQLATEVGNGVLLKVIVDPDMPSCDDSPAHVIDSGQLCWGNLNGTLFSFDRARGESIVFLPETRMHEFKALLEEFLSVAVPILADIADRV